MTDITYKWKQEVGKPVRQGDVMTEADGGTLPSRVKDFQQPLDAGRVMGPLFHWSLQRDTARHH